MTRRTSLPPHLEYRKSGYLWRRRVPTTPYRHSCETSFSKKFFSFSIRTHIDRDAKIIAQRLTALSDMLFTRVRENTMAIAPDIAERLLTELVRFEIDTFERMRAVADPMSPALAQLELDRELALQDTLRTAIFLGDRTIADPSVWTALFYRVFRFEKAVFCTSSLKWNISTNHASPTPVPRPQRSQRRSILS